MEQKPKDDLSAFIPEGWEGKYPPCLIQVDENGKLFHDGAPMIHPGILELIYESVYFEDGIYFLKVGKQSCQLEVADTFHVVTRAEFADSGVELTISDGSTESLDPRSLWIGNGEVLYCMIKDGKFPARFLRQAYYQITERLVEHDGGFALDIGGQIHPLTQRH